MANNKLVFCCYTKYLYDILVYMLLLCTQIFLGGEGSGDLTPVDPGRFQVLDIDERQDIKTFVQKNGLLFKAGRGFYEFTKAEKISDKKEVVLVDKVTIHVCPLTAWLWNVLLLDETFDLC